MAQAVFECLWHAYQVYSCRQQGFSKLTLCSLVPPRCFLGNLLLIAALYDKTSLSKHMCSLEGGISRKISLLCSELENVPLSKMLSCKLFWRKDNSLWNHNRPQQKCDVNYCILRRSCRWPQQAPPVKGLGQPVCSLRGLIERDLYELINILINSELHSRVTYDWTLRGCCLERL